MQRVPVVDKHHRPLMPAQPARVRKWLREGKAIKHWSDTGMFYIQLTFEPSGSATQDVVLGMDPGKHFSGVAVQSAKVSLFTAHLVLPFKTVRERMEQRRTLRRTRRSRRINRTIKFKQRNHRQERFSNRIKGKLPPSIRANRQLELRVAKELAAILPISQIVWEYVKADVDMRRKKARSGKGFSPIMVGQKWMIKQLGSIAPVSILEGWQTSTLRTHLGLAKSKNKAEQTPESHAVDGIALAASAFVEYRRYWTGKGHGSAWFGSVSVTPAPFVVLRRPPVSRRQLHLLQPSKGGVRRKYGGTLTRHGLRKGDFVQARMGERTVMGWVSGDTDRQVSVSDGNWKRLGQFTASKVQLIHKSTGLIVGLNVPASTAVKTA